MVPLPTAASEEPRVSTQEELDRLQRQYEADQQRRYAYAAPPKPRQTMLGAFAATIRAGLTIMVWSIVAYFIGKALGFWS